MTGALLFRAAAVAAVLLMAAGLAPGPGTAQETDGAALAEALGCGACHQGLPGADAIRTRAPAFGPGEPPLPAEFVFTYLADPQPRRPEAAPARMPDFRLREDERLALALFLGTDGAGETVSRARGSHPGITAGDGALLFRGLGCAGCHGHPEAAPAAGPVGPELTAAGDRYRRDWLEAFMAAPGTVRPAGFRPGTGSRMPDFRLSPGEVAALGGYLANLGSAASPRGGTGPGDSTPWGRSRAEGYLRDRLSCLGCHTWRGVGGRIAPPLDGLPGRLAPEEIRRMVHDPGGTRPGTLMPRSPFRRDIVDQVAGLLAADTAAWRPGAEVPVSWEERRRFLESAGSVAEPMEPLGAELYTGACAQCHGVRGDGAGFNAAFLPVAPTAHADAAAMSLRPDDTLHDGIAAGGWVLDGSHRMPAFGGRLTRDQVRSVVGYIRELCDCAPPAWSTGGSR